MILRFLSYWKVTSYHSTLLYLSYHNHEAAFSPIAPPQQEQMMKTGGRILSRQGEASPTTPASQPATKAQHRFVINPPEDEPPP